MSLPKAKFREILVNVLYSQSFDIPVNDEMILLLMIRFKTTKKNIYQVMDEANRILESREKIDELIETYSQNFAFDRITYLERAALRVGFFELFIDKKEPPKVCINEAIRITKKFGSDEAAKFVNAILDEAYQNELNC